MRVALPNKGRLVEEIKVLLADAGLPLRGNGERSLRADLGEDFEALFVRAQDIPELVADGAADVGITGHDVIAESGRQLVEQLDLAFGKCRLVVAAVANGSIQKLEQIQQGVRIATSFPRLTRSFFERRGIAVEIVPVSGAAEIAPHLGIADIIVDLVSSGSTLRMNGLAELETVLTSSARLFARPQAVSDPRVGELKLALDSVLRARGQRYLMANVPREALPRMREVLPGLNGPTLSEIQGGSQMVAMHAVVPEGNVYRIIAQLKALGCVGILVTRIERLVP